MLLIQALKGRANRALARSSDQKVDDLHALLAADLLSYLNKPDDIHFNGLGNTTMGTHIAGVIIEALGLEEAVESP